MDDLYLALSVVFPLFCMMALGYFLQQIGMFTDEFLTKLNALCFKAFLPPVLFLSIYNSDFFGLFSVELVVYGVLSIIIAFILLLLLIPRIEKENANIGVIIQGAFRSNFVLFGIPVTASIYGAENTGVTAILIAFVVPLFNILAVLVLSMYSNKKQSTSQTIKNIMKNPLIIASILGFIFALTRIKLPVMFEEVLGDVSQIASPLALIALGGSFQFKSVGKYIKQLSITVLSKLVVLPAIAMGVAVWLGFRGMELCALMVMLTSPTAVSSYTMAQSSNANGELAGQVVVMTSLFSIFTVFLWIFTLKQFNLI